METPQKVRTLFLAVLVLPLLLACADEITEPVTDFREGPGMVVRPSEVVLAPGETLKLEAFILDGGDEIHLADIDLEWNSTHPNVVEPMGEGLIKGLEPGLAVIVADYRNFTAEARVRVTKDEEGEDWK